ncbi:MAG: MarR family transcriptional regulator [Actinobacteria bacterium]|nr:MarR family transcriptional regulator [Actinomycetota bacterium]
MEEAVRWFDEKEMAAWGPFVVSTMHLMAQLERDLKHSFDVTLLDHGILLMLQNSPNGLTMGHLADQFGTEASVITYRLTRLEERGFAQRARSQEDSREVHARITSAGVALCDQMGPVHITSVRKNFIDHVPRRDLPAIADAFEKLYGAQRGDGI